jgi:hypothetical protein
MVHAKGGYIPRLLRPGPLSLDGGLYTSASLFRVSRLVRLYRGRAAGLTRRRSCSGGRGGVGHVVACSGTTAAAGGIACGRGCAAISRDTKSRLSESAQPLRQQRQ